jgi:hypothetical protein
MKSGDDRMRKSDEIFIINEEDLKSLPWRSMREGLFGKTLEDALQTLLQNYPNLIPGRQIDPSSDDPPRFVLLRREMPVAGWSLDHLYVDQLGVLTLVETKLIQNPESRRAVIGQIIEYAANAQEVWGSGRVRQYAAEFWSRDNTDLVDIFIKEFGEEFDEDIFWQTVENNLRDGRIRLIVAADELQAEVRRMIEYLNHEMQNAEVFGLELRCYGEDRGELVLVPQLIGQSEMSRQTKKFPGTRKTTQADFLSGVDEETHAFFQQIFDLANQEGFSIYWGNKGFSLRIADETGRLISVLYGFPTGSHGRAYAFLWAQTRNILDDDYRTEIYQTLISIPDVIQYGQTGVELPLDPETMESAREMLRVMVRVAERLRAKAPPTD